jgi:hypothetical protein
MNKLLLNLLPRYLTTQIALIFIIIASFMLGSLWWYWYQIVVPQIHTQEQGKVDLLAPLYAAQFATAWTAKTPQLQQLQLDELASSILLAREPSTGQKLFQGIELEDATGHKFIDHPPQIDDSFDGFMAQAIVTSNDLFIPLGLLRLYYSSVFFDHLQTDGQNKLLHWTIIMFVMLIFSWLLLVRLLWPLRILSHSLVNWHPRSGKDILAPLPTLVGYEIRLVYDAMNNLLQELHRERNFLEERVQYRTCELQKAMELARIASKAKSEFLANVSHEIRTPMNAVLGLAHVLKNMDLPSKASELADKIHNSGEALLGILNAVLDFSKIEAGQLEIEQIPFDINDVLHNLSSMMTLSAVRKGLEFIITPPPTQINYVIGDGLRVGQVLMNLVSNAIKFTDTGGSVAVKIELIRQQEDQVTLCFTVTDTGIGMDSETQQRLFEPFTQADASTTRRFGGTGLGLAISRQLVTLMNGQLTLSSTPNVGTTFSFTLTFKCLDGLVKEDILILKHLHIVFAAPAISHDQDHVLTVLQALGCDLQIFNTGTRVLDYILNNSTVQSAHTVLLLDQQLPEHSGLAVAKTLRAQLSDYCPILLLINQDQEIGSEGEEINDVVDAILQCPLTTALVHHAIIQNYNARHQIVTSEDLAMSARPIPITEEDNSAKMIHSQQRLAGLRLLVVDDSEINCEVAEQIFGYEGAQIYLVGDGQQALHWMSAHPNAVDIILMDIHMPVMDGLEATQRIHQIPACAKIPIIALTAGALQKQREQALNAGMCGFIPKPFVVDEAVALIQRFMQQAPTKTESVPVTAPVLHSELTTMTISDQKTALLNSDFGLTLFKKSEIYHRYLALFIQQYHSFADAIRQLDGDFNKLREVIHKLKGAAGNLGLERLAAEASDLEVAILHHHDAEVDNLITTVQQTLNETIRTIKAYLMTDEVDDDQ